MHQQVTVMSKSIGQEVGHCRWHPGNSDLAGVWKKFVRANKIGLPGLRLTVKLSINRLCGKPELKIDCSFLHRRSFLNVIMRQHRQSLLQF